MRRSISSSIDTNLSAPSKLSVVLSIVLAYIGGVAYFYSIYIFIRYLTSIDFPNYNPIFFAYTIVVSLIATLLRAIIIIRNTEIILPIRYFAILLPPILQTYLLVSILIWLKTNFSNASSHFITSLVLHLVSPILVWIIEGFAKRSTKDDKELATLSRLTDKQKRTIMYLDIWDIEEVRRERQRGNNNFVEIQRPADAVELLNKLSIEELKHFEAIKKLSDEADAGEYPKDIELYKRVLELAPWDSISIMSIGSSFFNAGNHQEAVKWMKKALSIDPDNPRIKENLEEISRYIDDRK